MYAPGCSKPIGPVNLATRISLRLPDGRAHAVIHMIYASPACHLCLALMVHVILGKHALSDLPCQEAHAGSARGVGVSVGTAHCEKPSAYSGMK
jgi:hypothetical protein